MTIHPTLTADLVAERQRSRREEAAGWRLARSARRARRDAAMSRSDHRG
jgi:hypothetical protein